MFKDAKDMIRHMELRHWLEKEDLEFKSGMDWNGLAPKIVKTALAMANLQGGGYIVIGVKENRDKGAHEIDAMPLSVSRTYSPDNVSEYLNAHADPDIDAEVVRFEHEAKHIVAIQVHEFKEVPVICKKGIDGYVKRGEVYCRSPKPETVTATSRAMRDMIDMAVDKSIAKQIGRVESYGGPRTVGDPFLEEAREEMSAGAQQVMSSVMERGHWKVEIRPALYRRDWHSQGELKDALAASQIRHRGWFYPHIAGRYGEMYTMGRCVESWLQWHEFAEVFRFYASGRFVHHIGMVEDRDNDAVRIGAGWSPGRESPAPEVRFIRAASALYYLTEIYLFASNLAKRGMIGTEADIAVTLYNQAGRILRFGDRSPLLFVEEGASQAQTIRLGSGRISTGRLREGHDALAVTDWLKLAEVYNVTADGLEEAARSWQGDFYRRRF